MALVKYPNFNHSPVNYENRKSSLNIINYAGNSSRQDRFHSRQNMTASMSRYPVNSNLRCNAHIRGNQYNHQPNCNLQAPKWQPKVFEKPWLSHEE